MPSIAPSKTQRLYLVLRDQIVSGVLRPGDRLPSEPSLATRHSLSRVTIRRALDGLEQDGLIDRVPGAGTFVRDAAARKGIVADLSNMLSNRAAMGRTTRIRLLEFGYCTAPDPVAEALRLPPGGRVQRSIRVRTIDGAPFSHLTTCVPESIGVTYSESDLSTTPLLSLLERSGVAVDRANQIISATLATPDIAEHLDVQIGSALIAVTRIVYDSAGKGVEYVQALYRPDLHTFQIELRRTGSGASRQWSPQALDATGKRRTASARSRR